MGTFIGESATKIIYLFLKDSAGYAEAEQLCSINAMVWGEVIDMFDDSSVLDMKVSNVFDRLFEACCYAAADMVGIKREDVEIYHNGMCSTVTLDDSVEVKKAFRFDNLLGDFEVYHQGECL